MISQKDIEESLNRIEEFISDDNLYYVIEEVSCIVEELRCNFQIRTLKQYLSNVDDLLDGDQKFVIRTLRNKYDKQI